MTKTYWYIEGQWKWVKHPSWSPMHVDESFWSGKRKLYFGGRVTSLFDTYSKAKSLAKREMKRDPDLDLRVRRATTEARQ